eukprot:1530119-Amphidinium_carterae.1
MSVGMEKNYALSSAAMGMNGQGSSASGWHGCSVAIVAKSAWCTNRCLLVQSPGYLLLRLCGSLSPCGRQIAGERSKAELITLQRYVFTAAALGH